MNKILLALNIREQQGKPMYHGSVPDATIAARRRKNKAARRARRAARK